jgi:hypothetical protein
VALFGGGVYLLFAFLTSGGTLRGWMIMGAALMLALGGYWLWVDYIAPAVGKGTTDA